MTTGGARRTRSAPSSRLAAACPQGETLWPDCNPARPGFCACGQPLEAIAGRFGCYDCEERVAIREFADG